ncbi:hypothetical protein ACOKFD_17860 [Flagellimonas sp. S174]|uniref:hypothetical protein n=1 Tax=Flagellimonas sp. S174 TaxID=3410790 RepID=UPI003BF5DB7B
MKKVKFTATILLKTMALVLLTFVFSCDDDYDDDYENIDESTPQEGLVHYEREMNCYV